MENVPTKYHRWYASAFNSVHVYSNTLAPKRYQTLFDLMHTQQTTSRLQALTYLYIYALESANVVLNVSTMAAACVYTLHTMPNALQIGEIDNRMLPWLRSLQGTYYKTLNMTDETRHCEGIGQPSLNIDQWLQASLTVCSSGLIYMIITGMYTSIHQLIRH